MITVNEVSKLTGVSVRTLQYYDEIGLLLPSGYTDAGYRLYDDAAIEKLQQILLFKELEFPLKQIKEIVDSPDYDRNKAIEQQIELLILKKEHLENLITFARGIKLLGVKHMDYTAFDTKKLDEHSKRAKSQWGKTEAYKEFEKKSQNRTSDEEVSMAGNFMKLFAEMGEMKELDPADGNVQMQVKKIQEFITENFYSCTKEILKSLGKMYAAGGEFTDNIDRAGGKGTAEFTAKAIAVFCF